MDKGWSLSCYYPQQNWINAEIVPTRIFKSSQTIGPLWGIFLFEPRLKYNLSIWLIVIHFLYDNVMVPAGMGTESKIYTTFLKQGNNTPLLHKNTPCNIHLVFITLQCIASINLFDLVPFKNCWEKFDGCFSISGFMSRFSLALCGCLGERINLFITSFE